MQKIKLDTRTVVTIGIGAALYGALGIFGFPIGPNTYVKPAVAILTIFGALFGPIVGFLVGFIGHCISDMMNGGGIWWGWVLCSSIMGGFMGFIAKYKGFSVKNGIMNKAHIVFMILTTIIGIVVGLVFAGGFDVAIMGEPKDKIVVQVIGAIVSNLLVFFIIGLPAVLAFVKKNKNNSNLTLDK